MEYNNDIEEDVNLFDVVDSEDYEENEEKEFINDDEELDFENGSLDGYSEMLEDEDEESDILE